MSAKKGLGTGLNALFGEAEREAEGEIRTLPISRVEPREDQPRVSFDEASLQELAEAACYIAGEKKACATREEAVQAIAEAWTKK